MRPQNTLRPAIAAGTLGLGISLLATAPLAAHAAGDAALATASPVAGHIAYGQAAVLQGTLPAGAAGQRLELEFQAAGSSSWVAIASAAAQAGGAYRLSAPLERSGRLRALLAGGAQIAGAFPGAGAPIAVGAGLAAQPRVRNLLAGRADSVSGTVLPAIAGRAVTLQLSSGHAWATVARARTTASGHFVMRFTPRNPGSPRLRVRFAGDAVNAASRKRIGAVNVYRPAGASWYGPGGSLACGGSLDDSTQGVANKTLPCGTLVTLRHGGRTVRVPVIDRGPYVAGRDYDLTPATKRALGFGDTGTIWATR
ncbi:MAG: septal ring lytic transglycosylase RlpA family protein [Solirubrobacteraceae bacterium]